MIKTAVIFAAGQTLPDETSIKLILRNIAYRAVNADEKAAQNLENMNLIKLLQLTGVFIIAVDGGLEIAKKLGLKADVLIGDLDSVTFSPEECSQYAEEIIKYDSDKDDSDTFLALNYLRKFGYKEVFIFGACGDRYDHFFANIQSLLHFKNENMALNLPSFIISDKQMMCVLSAGDTLKYQPTEGQQYFSLFSLSPRSCLKRLTNCKYEVYDRILDNALPQALSNEFIKDKILNIDIDSGSVLFICDLPSLWKINKKSQVALKIFPDLTYIK